MWIATLLASVLLATATLIHVYRGGTTWNDHFVAAVVVACLGVYPVLMLSALDVGIEGLALWSLAVALGLGAMGIYVLFFVLDRRKEAKGITMGLAMASQPAYAFSLWAGLVVVVRTSLIGLCKVFGFAEQAHLVWPGWWLVIPTFLTFWGTVWTFWRHNRVRKVTIQVPRLGRERLRLVHVSDIHASPIHPGHHVRAMVEKINDLRPDVVAITGDMVMPFSEAHHSYLIEALKHIEAPAFCCPGNHDVPIREKLGEELESVDVRWLVDDTHGVLLGRHKVLSEIVGVDFHWKEAEKELNGALDANPPLDGAQFRLLLAHDPRLFQWVPTDRFDLVLSGHTHGGQVGTDMFGLPWSVLRIPGFYDQGLFRRGDMQLYVHRGNWHTGLPPRMGIAGEIVVFELEGARPEGD